MRLSIDKRDNAYKSDHYCTRFRVFLDGIELFDCVTADTEKGFVIRQWVTRHPVTHKHVMQRSGLIRGVVVIVAKGVPAETIVFDESSDIKVSTAPIKVDFG